MTSPPGEPRPPTGVDHASTPHASTPRFSLLHATWRSGEQAVRVRDAWLDAALSPDDVEHIFCYDDDDEISMATPEIARGWAQPGLAGRASAVRNWNAAARVSSGQVLVVISDDLYPCRHWDSALDRVIGALDPTVARFVIKVNDHDGTYQYLIRHPVISRAYFTRFGLWNEMFPGYGVDDDFTFAARRRNLVIDAEFIRFEHTRTEDPAAKTESQLKMEQTATEGEHLIAQMWPRWKRPVLRVPMRYDSTETDIASLEYVLRTVVGSITVPIFFCVHAVRSLTSRLGARRPVTRDRTEV